MNHLTEENQEWVDGLVKSIKTFYPKHELGTALKYALTGKIASLEAEIERLKAQLNDKNS